MSPTHPAHGLLTGMDVLLTEFPDWIRNARIGLVSHQAAVDQSGRTSAERLHECPGVRLSALFGPEHGFSGVALAGESTRDERHGDWNIPVYSLYGESRSPSPESLESLDLLVVELQDLGARPYTYVSTLRLVLEAASKARKPVIVADRPIPLASQSDGPFLDPRYASFVALIPTPMQYGMTQAETALYLRETLQLDLDLRVAPMRNYHRNPVPENHWPRWVPPSPRIRSWSSACLFSATVFGEALPAIDYGSGSELAFQVVGAPWLNANALCRSFNEDAAEGVILTPCRYLSASGAYRGQELEGARLTIRNPQSFRPVTTSVILLDHIHRNDSENRLWTAPDTRPDWFDKLYGTHTVRKALQAGTPGRILAQSWNPDLAAFGILRSRHLLYSGGNA